MSRPMKVRTLGEALEIFASDNSGVRDECAVAAKQDGPGGIVRLGSKEIGKDGSRLLISVVSVETDSARGLESGA